MSQQVVHNRLDESLDLNEVGVVQLRRRPKEGGAKTVGSVLGTILCIAIAISGIGPFLTKSLEDQAKEGSPIAKHFVSQNQVFRSALIVHIATGPLALLLTPLAISKRVRRRFPRVHRITGRVSGILMLISGASALMIAQVSYGGSSARVGFSGLALVWLFTSIQAVRAARARKFSRHREWAMRAGACTFSAVVLRLQLAIMIGLQRPVGKAEFNVAFDRFYWVTAFSSWIPTVIVMELWLRGRRARTA
jgi:uncharacterized membrane protein